jgi:K+-sensing histidine kinase KdpD
MLMPLIDNIMDLAKLESGVYSVEKDNYNIVDIIEDVVYEFNKRLDVNDIDIVFDTDEEEKIANIDPKDIEKTLLILLSFIIRYSNNKSVINVDLKNSKDETTIYIKNIGGYTNDRYINDKDKKNLDVGISMAKLIIALYNGEIKIVNKNEDIIVEINLKLDDNITDYKNRKESQTRDMLYADYIRMCNF